VGIVLALVMLSVAIFNVVKAERIAATVRQQWDGRRMPRPHAWLFGEPPSEARIRRTNGLVGLLFGRLILVRIAF
jgi:hypothetical protein